MLKLNIGCVLGDIVGTGKGAEDTLNIDYAYPVVTSDQMPATPLRTRQGHSPIHLDSGPSRSLLSPSTMIRSNLSPVTTFPATFWDPAVSSLSSPPFRPIV
jgi:hypothetical protein